MTAVVLAHLAELPERPDAGGVAKLELAALIAAFGDVDGAVAYTANRLASADILLEQAHKTVGAEAFFIGSAQAAGRGLFNAVFEKNAADGKRLKYMRILVGHVSTFLS
jgi:hypothetical protein